MLRQMVVMSLEKVPLNNGRKLEHMQREGNNQQKPNNDKLSYAANECGGR